MSDTLPAETWLDALLRHAPRRFGMPPLPDDEQDAATLGPAAALAWAMEQARRALAGGQAPAPAWGELFVRSLASLVNTALQDSDGNLAFQARLLQAQSAPVEEYVRLVATAHADRREVRSAVNAMAHPDRLRHQPAQSLQATLLRLHDAVQAGHWTLLDQRLDDPALPPALRENARLREALARLARVELLVRHEDVQRLATLRARQTPAAAPTSASRGRSTEAAAAQAFAAVAACMNRYLDGGEPRYRALARLLLPTSFPGEPERSKNEWDIALVRDAASVEGAQLLLLAEAKAAPEAAVADLPTLLRGLQRFGQAREDLSYPLPCEGGAVRLAGRALQRLQPADRTLPSRVVYVTDAHAVNAPPWLDAAARGLLLAQPQVVAFALGSRQGPDPDPAPLHALWTAMTRDGRLRSVLHQYDSARRVREALLHVDDLQAASALAL
jgi:hypothetical protein